MSDRYAKRSPYPYMGNKSACAEFVWQRMGAVGNFVEPFAGSGSVWAMCPLLAKPICTLNDTDGLLTNANRALGTPDETTYATLVRHASGPINEIDLHSRHVWLLENRERIVAGLNDPDWCDPKAAGWWIWGCCCWIGGGWCSGKGPWWVDADGHWVKDDRGRAGIRPGGVWRQLPFVCAKGTRSTGTGLLRATESDEGQLRPGGVWRQLPSVCARSSGSTGTGLLRPAASGDEERVRHHLAHYRTAMGYPTRIVCGAWTRVVKPSVLANFARPQKPAGCFLDPPYGNTQVEYAGTTGCASELEREVWAWACANGDDPRLRIVVAGHDDGRDVPEGWTVAKWQRGRGYAAGGEGQANRARERLWCSPHCCSDNQLSLF